MNVRAKSRPSRKPSQPVLDGTAKVFAFETLLGWIGIAHVDQIITRIKFGYQTEQAVLAQFELGEINYSWRFLDELDDYERDLKDSFSQFAAGELIDFDDLDVDQSWMTPFQRAVTDSCRSIPYGETQTYGELAAISGSPKAARAVGSVMSNNPFPLIVPCHRVVSGGGRIGGFSAPRGISLKLRLLQLEGAAEFKEKR